MKSCIEIVDIQDGESFAKISDTLIFLLMSAGNLPVIKTKWVSRLKGNLLAASNTLPEKLGMQEKVILLTLNGTFPRKLCTQEEVILLKLGDSPFPATSVKVQLTTSRH
jgi:hypothetical protein